MFTYSIIYLWIFPDADIISLKEDLFMSTLTVHSESKKIENFEELFKIVPVSRLSLESNFIKGYTPRSLGQKCLKDNLLRILSTGNISDFRKPIIEPCVYYGNIAFSDYLKPTFTNTVEWWDEKIQFFLPEKSSRIMSPDEYTLFCGVLIEKLAETMNLEAAWKAVCDDSSSICKSWISTKLNHDYTTVKKLGWGDLMITQKLLKDKYGYYFAGSSCNQLDGKFSLAEIKHISDWEASLIFSYNNHFVGSIVTSV